MKFSDLSSRTNDELQELLAQNLAELHALEQKAHSGQLKQVHKISEVKTIIAQINTLLSAKKK